MKTDLLETVGRICMDDNRPILCYGDGWLELVK